MWRIEPPLPQEIRPALEGQSLMLCHLLYCRGYHTPESIQSFFEGRVASHDPFLLPDMDVAVERIRKAVDAGETVAVYGDFDCDGITSAVVLETVLRRLGLDPIVHIPTREDGHGLHPHALAALADRNVSLIVTADCGITAIEEVRVARGMGMDVIITDHHEARADGSIPDCPTIDPTRHDSVYPCRFLCGVGVAYKLAQALTIRISDAVDPDELLDLVALGTIADVVPLRDENRALVVRGLRCLRETRRPGLLALFEAAGIDRARIDPVSVGFYVAPRINAANRLALPQMAYELITTDESERAAELAAQLGEYNRQRQALVAEHTEALTMQFGDATALAEQVRSDTRSPVLIAIGAWPPGISGLLASKLVDVYGLPAFVGCDGGDGVVSVSARGVPGVHIDELLEVCEASVPGGLFIGHGGHSGAGGFRVAAERMEEAIALLERHARERVTVGDMRVLAIDAEVTLGMLSLEAARRVRSLAPFGVGFPEPLFLARRVEIAWIKPTGNGAHARAGFKQGTMRLDGVHFYASKPFLGLQPGKEIDIVFHLQVNEWNGYTKPELCIRDWRLSR